MGFNGSGDPGFLALGSPINVPGTINSLLEGSPVSLQADPPDVTDKPYEPNFAFLRASTTIHELGNLISLPAEPPAVTDGPDPPIAN